MSPMEALPVGEPAAAAAATAAADDATTNDTAGATVQRTHTGFFLWALTMLHITPHTPTGRAESCTRRFVYESPTYIFQS